MEYLEQKVGKLELKNNSATVCSLECYYKINKNDKPTRITPPSNSSFPVGQSKTINLNDLSGLPNGAWITAYANVSGDDSEGETWAIFEKGNASTIRFEVTGTAFKTWVSYLDIIESDIYLSNKIGNLELRNNSATVCSLECYYKINKSDTPLRIVPANSGSFPVGQSKTISLNELAGLPNGAWVTAYANVSAGDDSEGNTWLLYEKGNNEVTGIFEVTGTTFKTWVTYINAIGDILKGYAIPVSYKVLDVFLDHTYVYSTNYPGGEVTKYKCWGGCENGAEICSGVGDCELAAKIAGEDGNAKISYGYTGVCHQTANRILYPARIFVNKAKGYALSVLTYGVYGTFFKPPTYVSYNEDTLFASIQKIESKYVNLPSTIENMLTQRFEEFSVVMQHKLGRKSNITDLDLKSRLETIIKKKTALDDQLNNKQIDLKSYGAKINELANITLQKFAEIMSDSDYAALFDYKKGEKVELVDLNKL